MPICENIAIIGTGNMGEALIKGILQAGLISKENLIASDIDKQKLTSLQQTTGIRIAESNLEAITDAEIIILSIKPQIIGNVLNEIAPHISSKILISIAAGITIKFIEERLGKEIAIIRAMPNTPCLIGAGISALSAGKRVDDSVMKKAHAIFESVGKVVIVEEKLMDAVTAISGCGPAYIFTLIETLSDAGVELGLSRDVALTLSAQTVEGAAKLVNQTREHPAILKEKVTSPAGATITGLHTLEKHNFRAALLDAVLSSAKRAKELSNH